ncbi:MAG: transcription antitermination factor NusB [Ruminococcaceae bacterium]|nr:transcription antitermination factor NusB [Oscillospiraceae bacterium]
MNRRKARSTALEMLYESSFHTDMDMNEFYALTIEDHGTEDDEYLKKIFLGVHEQAERIDSMIAESAVGWSFERLSRMSLAIMRIAVYEMVNVEDVAYNIAINEAVELAKTYDHDKAPKFINGVLNTIAEKEGLKS